MRLLGVCAALAIGIALGLVSQGLSALWPAVAVVALFVALLGHGYAVRGWPLAVVALAGFMLVSCDVMRQERVYRDRFWLRDATRRERFADLDERRGPIEAIRADFSRRLGIGLEHDRETADLNRAIILGERTRLPRHTKRVFVEAGTLHVFAISGLHVMVMARLMVVLLSLLFMPFRLACVLAIPVLWLYVVMIGMPPSAVRASLMATFYLLAPLFYRKGDSITAWALTFIIVHVISPRNLFDVGSALSFVVMFGILVGLRMARELGLKFLSGGFGVSLFAWAAGLPIAAHVFGRVTPGGLLANLVLLPSASVSVVCGTLGVLSSYVSETLAAHLNALSGLFTSAMVAVSTAVSTLPAAKFSVSRWTWLVCAEWYVALALVYVLLHLIARRRRLPF